MCARIPNCVLLADRHHRFSEGVRGLLETAFSGVFLVADQASLMEGASRLLPDLVVVDVSLAEGDLCGLLGGIRARSPTAKILLLSVHDEAAVAAAAAAAGADGLILKREIATDLLPAVEALAGGERYVSSGIPH
jgi:DNA-binding NarL/FixJ family response regulator